MFDIDDFDLDQFSEENFDEFNDKVCKILMIGVGGAGCNAVTRLMEADVHSTDFVAVNTDVQALCKVKREAQSKDVRVPIKLVQIGKKSTRGLGAGAKPEKGKEAAEESIEDIKLLLDGAQMCFIAAGMGGGTGTGAAPVIAKVAKDMGILTVAVVTKPFDFEGRPRMVNAERGIDELKNNVDTLIVIPNDKLDKTSINNAFAQADDVLLHAIKGIGDLISQPLMINLDFADVCTVMRNKGYAHIGIGSAKGKGRAVDAVRQAVNNQLTETNIMQATGLIISYQAGDDFAIEEIKDATNLVRDVLQDDAEIIFGVNIVPELGERLDVVVIATGFQAGRVAQAQQQAAQSIPSFRPQPQPQAQPQPAYGAQQNYGSDRHQEAREQQQGNSNVPKFLRNINNSGFGGNR